MDPEIHRLQLSMINDSLSYDPTNPELILEKLRILRELSKFARIDLNEFKNLNLDFPKFNGNLNYFYHAWGVLDRWYEQNDKYNNFHVSVIGNQIVKIHNISTKYTEMNPNSFYYIGVVFGKQKNIRVPHWISEQERTTFTQEVQTKYGNLFHFPEAVDTFIQKSLIGIEECCPICMSDEDLETCVAVRNGRCDHAFHRDCIKRWFAQCGRRICPTCRVNHYKTG
jgi:hypothetical protein